MDKHFWNLMPITASVILIMTFIVITQVSPDLRSKLNIADYLSVSLLLTCFSILIRLLIINTESFELGKETKELHKLNIHKIQLRLADNKKGLARDIGLETLKSYLESFEVTKSGFIVNGPEWAMKCYRILWAHLIEKQELIGHNEDKCLKVFATHSHNIGIFLSDQNKDASQILDDQKRFIDAGGEISRVLIGDTPEPSDQYVEVKNLMEEKKIKVEYISVKGIDDLSYDFLVLNSDNMKCTFKWRTGMKGRHLESCEVLNNIDEPTQSTLIKVGTQCKSLSIPL